MLLSGSNATFLKYFPDPVTKKCSFAKLGTSVPISNHSPVVFNSSLTLFKSSSLIR